MKIMLFRDGQPGVVVMVAGDAAKAELEELLGGRLELTPLRNPLALVTRADGEAERLPIRYGLHREAPNPRAGKIAPERSEKQKGRPPQALGAFCAVGEAIDPAARGQRRDRRVGREMTPIAGDCAVVAVSAADGGLRDIKAEHLPMVECYVRPVG